MRVQLQRLLQLLLVGELFFSKPQRSEIVFSTRSRYFSTMGNLHSIWAVQYYATEYESRFDPTKYGPVRQERDDPDDAMTPMAIAAKKGEDALFDLFKNWNDGQLLTTKVKLAKLYFLMGNEKVDGETEDGTSAFTDLLYSIPEQEKKKVKLV